MGDQPGFNYDKGGRLYAFGPSYQNMKSIKRAGITINGEPVTELDLKTSHPRILAAKMGKPIPPSIDIYAGSSFPRDVLKMAITQILGSQSLPTCWSYKSKMRFGKAAYGPPDIHKLQARYPIGKARTEALKQFSLLENWKENPIDWGDLQFWESEVIIEAVYRLAIEHNVTALPVHDSLIVPKCKRELAKKVLNAAHLTYIETSAVLEVKY
jgi:hypothetical protein